MSSDKFFTSSSSEQRWVEQINNFFDKDEDEEPSVCVFHVPETLRAAKPESYTPQLIGLGPYHHLRQDLYAVESSYKLRWAKSSLTRWQQNSVKFQDVVAKLKQLEPTIRASYDHYLELDGDTLASIIAVDGLFLLAFFRGLADWRLERDTVLRDIMMLENQIPMFLLKKISTLVGKSLIQVSSSSEEEATVGNKLPPPSNIGEEDNGEEDHSSSFEEEATVGNTLIPSSNIGEEVNGEEDRSMEDNGEEDDGTIGSTFIPPSIIGVSEDLPSNTGVSSPITADDAEEDNDEEDDGDVLVRICQEISPLKLRTTSSFWVDRSQHLLDLMYVRIRPVRMLPRRSKKLQLKSVWSIEDFLEDAQEIANLASEFSPVARQVAKILEVITKFPWERFFGLITSSLICNKPDSSNSQVPSVSQLYSAGVKFNNTPSGFEHMMEFDDKEGTLSLPVITLKVTSEVVLRNLVAYEASIKKLRWYRPVDYPLAEYMDLMKGIIGTAKDIRLLREKGIVQGDLSDVEVVNLFNGMSSSKSIGKAKIIEKVLKYYNNRRKVKVYKITKKCAYAFWNFLTILFAVSSILLLILRVICSVYDCPSFLEPTSSGGIT